ncbi:MAG: hypothetical protein HQL88_08085 [Magnetococcales bacterium]|nr:hypothetical protein [Magnetococcales bacterium]
MRITSTMMFTAGMTAMQAQQQEILQAQAESTSGLKIQKPSDDPSGVFRHTLFSSDLASIQSLKRTTDLASQRLATGDTSLGTVHDNMMRAYELAAQFSHGTSGNDPAILKGSATSALAVYQNLLTVANSEMDGVPLFGGGRTAVPFDESHLMATAVQVQSNGTGSMAPVPPGFVAHVADSFRSPDGQTGVVTSYKIFPSATTAGAYVMEVNGTRQELPLSPIPRVGAPPYLDLGEGVTFDLGGPLHAGDAVAFTVVPDGTRFQATPSQLLPDTTVDGGSGETPANGTPVDASAGFFARVAPGAKLADLPLSVKVSYLSSSGEYAVNVNGTDWSPLKPVAARPGQPAYVDLGNGVTFHLVDAPQTGDVFFFEVVPAYQGGEADRPILVGGGKTMAGNATGAEWVEGGGSIGRGINLLGAAAALRGALLRGDSAEVAVQLRRLEEGRGQVSDFQAETGVREAQMSVTASTLAAGESSLQTLKASNSEADLFDVISRLQKATQTMQMLATTERDVLNLSLLDFIR